LNKSEKILFMLIIMTMNWGRPVHDDRHLFEMLILGVQKEFGSFESYLWGFVEGKTLFTKGIKTVKDYPVTTSISDKISNDLKKKGLSFCREHHYLRLYASGRSRE
jgi:3-methyladenine DNA glycosylase Tag